MNQLNKVFNYLWNFFKKYSETKNLLIDSRSKLEWIITFFSMSVNTFLLLLLVIANYTNLFLNIKNRKRWKSYEISK